MFVNEPKDAKPAPRLENANARRKRRASENEPIDARQASERLLAACLPRSVTIS